MNWKETLKQIKAGRDELRKYDSIMTPYEHDVIVRDLAAKSEAAYQAAYNGSVGEFRAAKNTYRQSLDALKKAEAAEIARFDSARLNVEMEAIQRRVDLALQSNSGQIFGGQNVAARLQSIYEEAGKSGDLIKQRAGAEIMSAALSRVAPNDREEVAHIAGQAERDLKNMRMTLEIEKAQQGISQAANEMLVKRDELATVGETLGDNVRGPFSISGFAKAMREVQVVDGTLHVYEPDAVELATVVTLPDK